MYNRRQHRTTFPRWALPHTGARIETLMCTAKPSIAAVAPHAGARIETRWSSSPMTTRTASLPTRERELKFTKLAAVATSGKSLPTPSPFPIFGRSAPFKCARSSLRNVVCIAGCCMEINGMAIPRQPATPLWWAVFFTAPLRVKQNPPGGGFWRVCCV